MNSWAAVWRTASRLVAGSRRRLANAVRCGFSMPLAIRLQPRLDRQGRQLISYRSVSFCASGIVRRQPLLRPTGLETTASSPRPDPERPQEDHCGYPAGRPRWSTKWQVSDRQFRRTSIAWNASPGSFGTRFAGKIPRVPSLLAKIVMRRSCERLDHRAGSEPFEMVPDLTPAVTKENSARSREVSHGSDLNRSRSAFAVSIPMGA